MGFQIGPLPNSGIFAPDAGDAMDGGGSLPSGSGIVDPPSGRPNRMQKYSKALQAAANYKKKRQAENEADAEVGKNGKDDDVVGPKGFKIGNDSTVVTGYRDPGFTLKGQKGTSILGAVGAGLTPFFPVTGQAIGAVGSLTGL